MYGMKVFGLIARWIFIIVVPIMLLSGTIAWAFNSLWIYRDGFAKYEVSQALAVSPSQLDQSAAELIAYFNNRGEQYLDINVTYDNGVTAPLYDQADILHMKDVKSVLWLDYLLLVGSAVYSIVYFIVLFLANRGQYRQNLVSALKRGGVATIGLLCFLGIFAITSFDWFFTTFHEIFFPQGNWQFPLGDHMITLFPDGFWSDVTLLVGMVALALALIVWLIGFASLRRIKANHVVAG
jgi:integral membrane protein (TIGR01906 family)